MRIISAVRMISKMASWFDQRLQLSAPIRETMQHPVPGPTASWAYVFGSAAMTAFGLQLITGMLLALVYVPSAGEAWSSLQSLNHQVAVGWFIRALHGWGSNFMIAIVLIHMAQVFLFGAHKYPRELTWIVGVPAAGHAGDGVHGSGAPLRPGCVLGPGHRRLDREPC